MPGRELKLIKLVADEYNINRKRFGNYVEGEKKNGRKGRKNWKGDYTLPNLRYLAKEYQGLLTGKESDDEVVE
jgi:hypothetical protein